MRSWYGSIWLFCSFVYYDLAKLSFIRLHEFIWRRDSVIQGRNTNTYIVYFIQWCDGSQSMCPRWEFKRIHSSSIWNMWIDSTCFTSSYKTLSASFLTTRKYLKQNLIHPDTGQMNFRNYWNKMNGKVYSNMAWVEMTKAKYCIKQWDLRSSFRTDHNLQIFITISSIDSWIFVAPIQQIIMWRTLIYTNLSGGEEE